MKASKRQTWEHTQSSLRAPSADSSATACAKPNEAGLLQRLRLPVRDANSHLRVSLLGQILFRTAGRLETSHLARRVADLIYVILNRRHTNSGEKHPCVGAVC